MAYPLEIDFECATPTGFDFYFDSYSAHRRPIWPWRHRSGWMRIIKVRAGATPFEFRRTLIVTLDDYGEPAPDYLGPALLQMATSLPFEPPDPEPEDDFAEAEEAAVRRLLAIAERHFFDAFNQLDARLADERERIENTVSAISKQLHRSLRKTVEAMRDPAACPDRLVRLERRRRRLEWAEGALGDALRAGLAAHRLRAEAEEEQLTTLAEEPPTFSLPVSIYWRLV